MKCVGLVASSNGFGHARRIFQLALEFERLGYSTTIFATSKQIQKLVQEQNLVNSQLSYCDIETHGIDGPTWLLSGGSITQPSYEVIVKLKKCDFIISDNVLWPKKYSKAFVLFGHFNWIDYWAKVDLFGFTPSLTQIYYEELQELLNVKVWFQFNDFALDQSVFPLEKTVPIKLINYISDSNLRNLVINKSLIWIANGTTGLSMNLSSRQRNSEFFKVEEKETFHLLYAKQKPLVVIGRPGLGTIRDCLAASVIFYPYWDKHDPELTSNVMNLKRFSLVYSTNIEETQIDSLGEQMISDVAFQNLWKEAQSKLIDDVSSVINQLVDFLN